MAETNPRINNYTLIELMHLSYLVRDSLEYCHEKIEVTQENFDRRAGMSKNMLAEGNFVQKWLSNHPNEEVKKFYPRLVEYFHNIYEEEQFVVFANRKVEPEKSIDFIEATVGNYQIVEDIIKAFYNEFKKTPGLIDERIEKCILASFDYYRVIANWLFFNEILKNDGEYKKALKASDNKQSYEVNYNLNILKRLIGGFNFNRQRYTGDKVDVRQMMDDSFQAFRALDGTLRKDLEKDDKKFAPEEWAKVVKDYIEKAANECVSAIRIYEPIWRQTYAEVVKYMQENPLNQKAPEAEANA